MKLPQKPLALASNTCGLEDVDLEHICAFSEAQGIQLPRAKISNKEGTCLEWSRCGLGDCERVCQAGRIESLDGDGQALK